MVAPAHRRTLDALGAAVSSPAEPYQAARRRAPGGLTALATAPHRSPNRVLVVGHSPPRGRAGRPALVGTQTGERLARLCGLPDSEALLDYFALTNLIPYHLDRFDPRIAALHAPALHERIIDGGYDAVVCLGIGLYCAAADAKPAPLYHGVAGAGDWWWFVSPHPSGRNRYWNDPLQRRRGEAFWRAMLRGWPKPMV